MSPPTILRSRSTDSTEIQVIQPLPLKSPRAHARSESAGSGLSPSNETRSTRSTRDCASNSPGSAATARSLCAVRSSSRPGPAWREEPSACHRVDLWSSVIPVKADHPVVGGDNLTCPPNPGHTLCKSGLSQVRAVPFLSPTAGRLSSGWADCPALRRDMRRTVVYFAVRSFTSGGSTFSMRRSSAATNSPSTKARIFAG